MKKFLLFLTLLISAIGAQAKDYKLVTSDSELEVGAKYIIVAPYTSNSTTTWYAMGAQSSNVRSTIVINAPSNEIVSITTEAVTPITLCNSNADSYQYNLQTGTNLYLYNSSTSNYLKEANLSADGVGSTANASISISDKSVATITFNKSKTDADFNATIFFNYNNGSPRFSCYFKKGQQPVYLYKEVTTSGGGGEDLKDCGLAYDPESVSLVEGEALTQPKLNNPNTLPVTYSSGNTDVATVDAKTGVISLAGGLGTAVITASTEGNDTHKAGSATFTITVAKQYVFADTKATLVTDANTLKAGDIIAIGHWSKTQSLAMTNSTSEKYFVGDNASYNADHSELTLTNTVLLMQLEEVTIGETTRWGLKTLNFDGEQGYVGGSAKAVLNVSKSADDKHTATITITDSKAKILFKDSWVLRCNTGTNPARFAAYAGSVEPVYIYKVETPTTIVGEDLTEVTMNEGQGPNTLSAMSLFSTNSTVDNFVVKMNGVTITSASVVREEDASGNNNITVNLSGLPYIPGAEFTIAPVVNGKEGHSEVLGIHMPALPTFTVTDSSRELMFNDEEATAGTCNIDAVIKLYVTSTAGEGAYGFNYYFDFENLSGFENHHWDWLNDSKGNGVTYVVEDYLTNVTTQAQGEAENVVYVPVLPSEDTSYPELVFNLKPYFVFNVTPELASLITEATPAPMAAPARAGEAFVLQNVYSTQVFEQHFNFSATTDVSGVEGVAVDGGAAVEYFNLQGVRVDGDLAPGIYIRRQGQIVSKVQIR